MWRRYSRAAGGSTERRKQLAWLGYVGVLTLLWIIALLLGQLLGGGGPAWIGNLLWILSVLTPVAGIPVACVVAVLKYRLYDIDQLISRTLAYAIVTGLLAGVYAGLVLLATRVLPLHTPVAVAGSTLVAAALFSPLRRRVQLKVDRRFNRARYDADQMVAAFSAGLKDTVDRDSVRDDLVGVVHQALEPTLVSVWVNDRGCMPRSSGRLSGRFAPDAASQISPNGHGGLARLNDVDLAARGTATGRIRTRGWRPAG